LLAFGRLLVDFAILFHVAPTASLYLTASYRVVHESRQCSESAACTALRVSQCCLMQQSDPVIPPRRFVPKRKHRAHVVWRCGGFWRTKEEEDGGGELPLSYHSCSHQHLVSPKLSFTVTWSHQNSVSPKLCFTKTQFHQNLVSPKLSFTKTQFHQNSVSPKLCFTMTHFYHDLVSPKSFSPSLC
jgi:hypothetical protein